jgi:DNA-binding MarR family transcriptional regulator
MRYANPVTTPLPEIERRPPVLPKELLASTAFLIAKVGFAIKSRMIEELEAIGFSMYQYSVLATVGEEARTSQATIADALSLDRSQLVGVLDGLEERGLIERRRDTVDRRRHTVSLTAEGKRELVRLRKVADRIENEFLKPLDEQTRALLHDTLLQVACGFDCRFERQL